MPPRPVNIKSYTSNVFEKCTRDFPIACLAELWGSRYPADVSVTLWKENNNTFWLWLSLPGPVEFPSAQRYKASAYLKSGHFRWSDWFAMGLNEIVELDGWGLSQTLLTHQRLRQLKRRLICSSLKSLCDPLQWNKQTETTLKKLVWK